LEADHVAAVATLASQSSNARHTLGLGAAWGLGHSVPLFVLGAAALMTEWMLPAGLGRWLDIGAGAMLVALGGGLLVRLARRGIHVHPHRHGDGVLHVHAHRHAGGSAPHASQHEHRHGRSLTGKAILVGMMHGLAGSGPLIVLTLETLHSLAWGLVYIAVFALGTLAGMALLTAVIALPLRFVALRLTAVHAGLQAAVGLGTLTVGVYLMQSLIWR
jgi:hypothetical protein